MATMQAKTMPTIAPALRRDVSCPIPPESELPVAKEPLPPRPIPGETRPVPDRSAVGLELVLEFGESGHPISLGRSDRQEDVVREGANPPLFEPSLGSPTHLQSSAIPKPQ